MVRMIRIAFVFLLFMAQFSSFLYAGGVNSRDSRLAVSLHFREGTGTVTRDETFVSTGATLRNGAAWVSGKYDNAVSLDGTNDYIEIPYSSKIELTTVTIGFWFKDAVAGDKVIVDQRRLTGGADNNTSRITIYQGTVYGGETSARRLNFSIDPDGGAQAVKIIDIGRDKAYAGASSLQFNDGKWHHVFFDIKCGTVNVASLKVVVDGGVGASANGYSFSMLSSTFGATSKPNTMVAIGDTANLAALNWGATVDEFFIFQGILPDGEKKRIYLEGKKGHKDQ